MWRGRNVLVLRVGDAFLLAEVFEVAGGWSWRVSFRGERVVPLPEPLGEVEARAEANQAVMDLLPQGSLWKAA